MIEKKCPICGVVFVCQPENPSACQCAGVELTAEQHQCLRARYADCLCRRCLIAFSKGQKKS